MKILLLLTTFLITVSPTGDPLSDLYLRQFLGVKFVPQKISKNFFHRQVEFNTKFLSTVVGPENLVSSIVNVNKRQRTTVSYSVYASPKELRKKLATLTHFTRKTYPMGYKIRKLQQLDKNDFKLYMSTKNKNVILYFKYNKKYKLFNVWMK